MTHTIRHHIVRGAGAAMLAGALAGCGMGGFMGGGGSSEQLADTSASQAEISQLQDSALPAIATECPPIEVRPGTESLFAYENDQVGNPRQLQFQAVIDEKSRNCVVSNGLITVKMGVVGRLILGPKSAQNAHTLPLRFAVERDGVPVFSQVYQIDAAVAGGAQSEEFVKVVENVAVPYLGGEDITIWVGFDTQA